MATRDIVVVGASAGGVEALIDFVGALPAGLPAAIFVVLHVPPYHPSHLPAILTRHGPLPADHARDSELITAGRIYIAPPDHHLILRAGTVGLTHGPRQNAARPAIDPLFRSAARQYGPRVVGIVLSGNLDDGALGLKVIASYGGVTIVQDPTEALFSGMPSAALNATPVDYVLPAARIAELIAQLAVEPVLLTEKEGLAVNDREDVEIKASHLAMRDIIAQANGQRNEETTIYTCPECGGTLWQINEGGLTQFSCHVGHSYGAGILLGHMSEELEAALWRCVRLLTEKATLTRQFAQQMQANGRDKSALRMEAQAEDDDRHGQLIRDLLLEGPASPLTDALEVEQVLDEAASGE